MLANCCSAISGDRSALHAEIPTSHQNSAFLLTSTTGTDLNAPDQLYRRISYLVTFAGFRICKLVHILRVSGCRSFNRFTRKKYTAYTEVLSVFSLSIGAFSPNLKAGFNRGLHITQVESIARVGFLQIEPEAKALLEIHPFSLHRAQPVFEPEIHQSFNVEEGLVVSSRMAYKYSEPSRHHLRHREGLNVSVATFRPQDFHSTSTQKFTIDQDVVAASRFLCCILGMSPPAPKISLSFPSSSLVPNAEIGSCTWEINRVPPLVPTRVYSTATPPNCLVEFRVVRTRASRPTSKTSRPTSEPSITPQQHRSHDVSRSSSGLNSQEKTAGGQRAVVLAAQRVHPICALVASGHGAHGKRNQRNET
ncbi:hypothetical protein C8R43DRAFT_1177546 [Mycena crocata]|nr:hypothetical protein C8R43DRAFT_1177546 [Mycena crocata]